MIIKNTAIEAFCEWGIVYSICALIFVLPVSIALLDSFAGLAVLFYFLKKINRLIIDWPVRNPCLNLPGRIYFIWKGFAPPVNFLNRPLQFLVLAVFVSVLFSQYPAQSLFAFMGKFLKVVFLYFSFIEAFSEQKRILLFLKFFLLSAFITVLGGGIQHYTGEDILKKILSGKTDAVSSARVNSTFFSANGLGAYLLPVIGLVTNLLFSAAGRRKTWGWTLVGALFLVMLLACLCWTYSRGSWIGFLVILFVTLLLDRRKILYAGVLLLVLIFIFLPSLNNVRHLHLINDNNDVSSIHGKNCSYDVQSILEQGGSGRIAFWKKAVSIIYTSPVWGTGLNTYAKILKRNPDQSTWWYAHNSYLQMAAETGFLGLTCFLWMIFVLLRQGLNYCHLIKDSWTLSVLQGAFSGLSGLLVQSFFDNTFFAVQLSVLLWLMIGLMAAVIRLPPGSRVEEMSVT